MRILVHFTLFIIFLLQPLRIILVLVQLLAPDIMIIVIITWMFQYDIR